MDKITNLTSRKFLVAIGALVTLLTGVELDDRRALVIVLIAVAYIVAEAAVDWRRATAPTPPTAPTPAPNPTAPSVPSSCSDASSASTETKTTNTSEA